MYQSLRRLDALPRGSTVVDVACGAGLALRWLAPGQIRYIGLDNSPAMVERARRAARRRGFTDAQIEVADVESLPLPDAVADVALLYNALHCLEGPEAAIAETVRCLKPRGRFFGSMLVRGAVPRVDRLIERDTGRHRVMGPGGTADDLRRWLASGLERVDVTTSGAMAVFEGVA
jgi:ubiquinone/menaquinone biosynthesis C-methylase UbiE